MIFATGRQESAALARRVVWSLLVAWAGASCRGPSELTSPVEGTYALVRVNGHAVPYLMPRDAVQKLTFRTDSGYFTLLPDGSYDGKVYGEFLADDGSSSTVGATSYMAGLYSVYGDTVVMNPSGPPLGGVRPAPGCVGCPRGILKSGVLTLEGGTAVFWAFRRR